MVNLQTSHAGGMRLGDGIHTYGDDMQNPHNSTASDVVSPTDNPSPDGSSTDGAAAGAGRAMDALSSTADYIRNNDLKSMVTDAERLVRNNPVPALLAAAVVGFLVGRALSRD